jgi:hypothetical protein
MEPSIEISSDHVVKWGSNHQNPDISIESDRSQVYPFIVLSETNINISKVNVTSTNQPLHVTNILELNIGGPKWAWLQTMETNTLYIIQKFSQNIMDILERDP